jgi:hypothetical protein
LIVRVRSKQQLASAYSSFRGIAGDYSDRRTPQSASRDPPGVATVQARANDKKAWFHFKLWLNEDGFDYRETEK